MKTLLLSWFVFVTGCAAGGGQEASPRPDRDALTPAEIQRTGGTDALTVVQTLRPHWLQRRGTATLDRRETVKVYLDGSLMGGPEQLRHINAYSISAMRHLDGLEATQRYGLGHGQGAILVYTRVEP
jgi:hypothetical protein